MRKLRLEEVKFSLVAQSCPTLCNPMNRSTPGLPVHHQLPEFTQTQVHRVSDAIQPSHPLSSPSPSALNLSQHQGLFKWVSSLHQVAKVLEFQLQHRSFQWTLRTDLLEDGLVGSPCNPRDSQERRLRDLFKITHLWRAGLGWDDACEMCSHLLTRRASVITDTIAAMTASTTDASQVRGG